VKKILFTALLLTFTPTGTYAQYYWNVSTGTANFLTATNWQYLGNVPAAPPGPADDVVISKVGTYVVTLGSSTSVHSLLIDNSGTTFNHTAGTFSLTAGLTLNNGVYNLTGGTVLLGNGMTMNGGTFNHYASSTLTVSGELLIAGGTYNLNGGTITGGSVNAPGGRLNVNSGTFDNVFISAGSLDLTAYSPGSSLTLKNGVTFGPSSTYTVGTSRVIAIDQGQTEISNISLATGGGLEYYRQGQ
jgi:hypothetical protein